MSPSDLLPIIGGLLQWARAQSKFSEILYVLIVIAASSLFYLLANPENAFSQRWDVILGGWWQQVMVILSATQLVSSTSNIINEVRPATAKMSAMLPVTNSQ